VCRLDAGSVADSSIVFPLNRTYSVLSGEIVFIVWDLVSTTDSTLGTMLPEDIFSDNQPLQRLLREKIIKPSILHIVEGAPGSAFFRCGSVVSLVAVKTSGVVPKPFLCSQRTNLSTHHNRLNHTSAPFSRDLRGLG